MQIEAREELRSDLWAKYCGRDLTVVIIHYSIKEGIEKKVTFQVMLSKIRHPKRSET